MKILFAGNKERGIECLRLLAASGCEIVGVIAHPGGDRASHPGSVAAAAHDMGFRLFQPTNVNDGDSLAALRELKPALTVLAGYGQIVKPEFIGLAPMGCINLHAGKLPQYRGSSPMNWALINGEREFTVSIIRVDAGVDTGDVLAERTFPISLHDTIADLQRTANGAFPGMLLDVVRQLQKGPARARKQEEDGAAYYPLRFPEDGMILWDLYSAEQVHNRIRALTDPYPGAVTFHKGHRVKLIRSKLAQRLYCGEPGRIYLKNHNGLLVCAQDRCLWVQEAVMADTGKPAFDVVQRYDKLATVRDAAVDYFKALRAQ